VQRRENHRAYAGSEAHATADPVDLGAPSDLIGAHEPMSIEAVLAAHDQAALARSQTGCL
jgi:hypothetical protein